MGIFVNYPEHGLFRLDYYVLFTDSCSLSHNFHLLTSSTLGFDIFPVDTIPSYSTRDFKAGDCPYENCYEWTIDMSLSEECQHSFESVFNIQQDLIKTRSHLASR